MPDLTMIDLFSDFCEKKISVNGPDIHMKAAAAGTEGAEDRVWRLTVYNNFCSTPPAAVIWSRFTEYSSDIIHGDYLESFIRENWAGIPIRQNRRPARSPAKLAKALRTSATWLHTDYPKLAEMSYEEAWNSLDSVYTWGRYVKVKFLETARAYLGFTHLEAPNIRASGGWSPRKALALMYPEQAELLTSKTDRKEVLAQVHAIAADLREYVIANLSGYPLSNYQLEALLCNFRQTLSTRKTFYVGRTIDSELEYDRKVRAHFPGDPYLGTFDFFATRLKAFPVHCLGEVQGWTGVRADLSDVLREHGYVWADTVYDYVGTEDLAHPRRWSL